LQLATIFDEGENQMDIHNLADLLANQGSGLPYRLIDTLNLSHRQIYAGDSVGPERGISADSRKYQRNT
jgi:hypothetical protein